jgi:hypothetical protein
MDNLFFCFQINLIPVSEFLQSIFHNYDPDFNTQQNDQNDQNNQHVYVNPNSPDHDNSCADKDENKKIIIIDDFM